MFLLIFILQKSSVVLQELSQEAEGWVRGDQELLINRQVVLLLHHKVSRLSFSSLLNYQDAKKNSFNNTFLPIYYYFFVTRSGELKGSLRFKIAFLKLK